MELSLSGLAQKAVMMAIEKSARDYGKPVCVSVCDSYGSLVAFHRADAAPLRSINIAMQKAYTAVRMGSTTAAFAARLQKEGVQASAFCDDKLTSLAGGVPICDAQGNVLAGIGISGLKPEEDHDLAASIAETVAKAP